MKKAIITIIICAVATLAAAVLCFAVGAWLVGGIPRDVMTRSNISGIRYRLEKYGKEHRRLPRSLSDLPPFPNDDESTFRDGWGREITYTFTPDGSVTLSSPGPDGAAGGHDDIVSHFTVTLDGVIDSTGSRPYTVE